jgi:hypothetical protein
MTLRCADKIAEELEDDTFHLSNYIKYLMHSIQHLEGVSKLRRFLQTRRVDDAYETQQISSRSVPSTLEVEQSNRSAAVDGPAASLLSTNLGIQMYHRCDQQVKEVNVGQVIN